MSREGPWRIEVGGRPFVIFFSSLIAFFCLVVATGVLPGDSDGPKALIAAIPAALISLGSAMGLDRLEVWPDGRWRRSQGFVLALRVTYGHTEGVRGVSGDTRTTVMRDVGDSTHDRREEIRVDFVEGPPFRAPVGRWSRSFLHGPCRSGADVARAISAKTGWPSIASPS